MKSLSREFSERKEKLQRASDKFKSRLKMDIGGSLGKIERSIIAGLLITGSLILVYKFTSNLVGGGVGKKNSAEDPSQKPETAPIGTDMEEDQGRSIIRNAIEVIALFLLAIAREKLLEFLEKEEKTGTEA